MNEAVASVINVTAQSFQREVVERSKKTPVLIDFWAPWCGPCKVLGPLLEKLAKEAQGAWVLAKVDTDQNPELAQAFQIQGIPAVMAVKDGKLVDGFTGALPERELRQFVDQLVGKKTDPVAVAKELEAAGDREGALQLLRQILREKPDHDDARIALASILCSDGKAGEARLVFDKLSETAKESAPAKAVQAQLDLAEQAKGLDAARAALAKNPEDVHARIAFARGLIGAQQTEQGLELLLEAVKSDPGFDGGAAKKAMIEAFEALGGDHPLTAKYRFQLQMVLLV